MLDPYLRTACANLRPPPDDLQRLAMERHWTWLIEWNATFNLTSITEPRLAAWLHYRDSLAALAFLKGGPVLDIGSGAGFPGLPLAIMHPLWRFVLMEPRRKRRSFLTLSCARLDLRHVEVLDGRMEESPTPTFAHVVTRATLSSPVALKQAMAWLKPKGTLLAWRQADKPVLAGGERHLYSLDGRPRALDVVPV